MGQYNAGKTVKIIVEKCYNKHIADEAYCKTVLTEIAKKIGMTIIAGPYSTSFKSISDIQKDGISAILMIAESHIACHTWPYHNAVRIVVDSCKDFDVTELEQFLLLILKSNRLSTSVA